MERYGGRTARLAGTAILATLVVVFDYSLKFSGLKIPFLWLPLLKFDFTGIPIALSILLYGLSSGATTSIVAFLAITFRSGKPVSALIKAIAEFSTILGIAVGLRLPSRWRRGASVLVGVALRIAAMSVTSLIVFTTYYGMAYDATVSMLPMIWVFNAIQGSLTVVVGYLLYEAYVRRVLTHHVGPLRRSHEGVHLARNTLEEGGCLSRRVPLPLIDRIRWLFKPHSHR